MFSKKEAVNAIIESSKIKKSGRIELDEYILDAQFLRMRIFDGKKVRAEIMSESACDEDAQSAGDIVSRCIKEMSDSITGPSMNQNAKYPLFTYKIKMKVNINKFDANPFYKDVVSNPKCLLGSSQDLKFILDNEGFVGQNQHVELVRPSKIDAESYQNGRTTQGYFEFIKSIRKKSQPDFEEENQKQRFGDKELENYKKRMAIRMKLSTWMMRDLIEHEVLFDPNASLGKLYAAIESQPKTEKLEMYIRFYLNALKSKEEGDIG